MTQETPASRFARGTILAALFFILALHCKKTPTTTTGDATQSAILVACSPSSAEPGISVTFIILITGNTQEINAFGGTVTFDSKMFQFQGVGKASLTESWAAVDGNEVSPGNLIIGGFAGSGTGIPQTSSGTLAEVRLKVTGAGYGNGQKAQVCILRYLDGLEEFDPQPACATFTLKK